MSLYIGIPRGLLYYHYGKLWERFFNELGVKVVVSDDTSKATLNCGSVLDEVCLPVKAYFGHVCEIYRKVDYLFLPRIVSVAQGQYTCPHIIGVTDLVRSNITDLPPIIDVNISLLKKHYYLYQSIIAVGQQLGKGALTSLYAWYKSYYQLADRGRVLAKECEVAAWRKKNIALIGHSYIIYDSFMSMNVLGKLNELGVNVLTADMVNSTCANRAAEFLDKELFWSYCHHLVGAAQSMLNRPIPVDGMIVMTSFACGPDSLMGEIIKRQAQAKGIPCMLLTMDEHAGENAFVTRLEAFIDLIKRRWV